MAASIIKLIKEDTILKQQEGSIPQPKVTLILKFKVDTTLKFKAISIKVNSLARTLLIL